MRIKGTARGELDPNAPDSGLIPPELFGRLLMRSQGSTTPEDNITDVIITPTPATELPDRVEVGYTPPEINPQHTAVYQPRERWKSKLLLNPPGNSAGWLAQLSIYQQRRTQQHQELAEAWAGLNFQPIDARNALERTNADRGSIPPELIGRVVARSGLHPDQEADDIIIYPELKVS